METVLISASRAAERAHRLETGRRAASTHACFLLLPAWFQQRRHCFQHVYAQQRNSLLQQRGDVSGETLTSGLQQKAWCLLEECSHGCRSHAAEAKCAPYANMPALERCTSGGSERGL